MKKAVFLSLTGVCMLLLILDGKTAVDGACDAIELCLYTVVPSLLPFLLISQLLNGILLGSPIPILRPIGKLCGVPKGAESLMLLGLIGGYPVGAQIISEACRNRHISKETAQRLLGFCNNAGPSFIFGIVSSQFSSPGTVWAIWLIHIFSAILTGALLSEKASDECRLPQKLQVSLPDALSNTITVLSKICGWVIAFRVIIAYIAKLISLPTWATTLLFGSLELTNGCVALRAIDSECLRYIVCICLLNFGGLCVAMQTKSVCGNLKTGLYFPGKLLQTVIGLVLGLLSVPLIFQTLPYFYQPLIVIPAVLLVLLCLFPKKLWHFRQESIIIKHHLLQKE